MSNQTLYLGPKIYLSIAKLSAEYAEQRKKLSKSNYDPSQARIDLCNTIAEQLNIIHEFIVKARADELSYASNEDVSTQDFDNLLHLVSQLYRLCDSTRIEAGAEDDYSYQHQKNFD